MWEPEKLRFQWELRAAGPSRPEAAAMKLRAGLVVLVVLGAVCAAFEARAQEQQPPQQPPQEQQQPPQQEQPKKQQRKKLGSSVVRYHGDHIAIINGRKCVMGGRAGGPFPPCPQRDPAKVKEERRELFAPARDLLLKHGVPFEPNLVLEDDFPRNLRTVLDSMPEMHELRYARSLHGVVLADTLYLAEHTTATGVTVILVNHIVFEGTCPVITGQGEGLDDFPRGGIHLFPTGPTTTLGMTLERALEKGGFKGVKFGGPHGLPPFSVIRDLDLPKAPKCGVTVDTSPSRSFEPMPMPPLP